MPDLTPLSPLMQPLIFQGVEYFTSQYFHRQYLDNKPQGGKYRQHSHFVRLLRSIEAYKLYLENGDICEMTWASAQALNLKWDKFYKSTGYQPITLLNATAQIAMAHHLDDELSKQLSVAANTHIARQSTGRGQVELELTKRNLVAALEIADIFGVPKHIAQQEAVKLVASVTGVDLHPLLIASPAQDHIPADEEMLEPADLGRRLQMTGPRVNKALEAIGWQRKHHGIWEPTNLGAPYAFRHSWTADHGAKDGYNYKWKVQAVRQAFIERGYLHG